jgi:hypothetical protein
MIIDLLEPIASLEELELAASLHPIERLQIARRAFPASPAVVHRSRSSGSFGFSGLFGLSGFFDSAGGFASPANKTDRIDQIDQIDQTNRLPLTPSVSPFTFHVSRPLEGGVISQ